MKVYDEEMCLSLKRRPWNGFFYLHVGSIQNEVPIDGSFVEGCLKV